MAPLHTLSYLSTHPSPSRLNEAVFTINIDTPCTPAEPTIKGEPLILESPGGQLPLPRSHSTPLAPVDPRPRSSTPLDQFEQRKFAFSLASHGCLHYRWLHREWTAGCYSPVSLQNKAMTRTELLRIVVLRARVHGFEFRQWFQVNLESEWPGFDQAVATLSSGRRYYALLFSHEFARHFWKKGTQITFLLPSQEYTRLDSNGKVVTIKRKSFTRRSSRSTSNNVWQYHLEQMAVWDEPLRYIRRFILTEEEPEAAGAESVEASAPGPTPVEPMEAKGAAALPRRAPDFC